MSDIHGNQTKWECSDPERYGLTDPNAGLICEECGGTGVLEMDDEYQRPIDVICPDCQGTGRPR